MSAKLVDLFRRWALDAERQGNKEVQIAFLDCAAKLGEEDAQRARGRLWSFALKQTNELRADCYGVHTSRENAIRDFNKTGDWAQERQIYKLVRVRVEEAP
jgi:hypothetical protein